MAPTWACPGLLEMENAICRDKNFDYSTALLFFLTHEVSQILFSEVYRFQYYSLEGVLDIAVFNILL